MPYDKTTWNAGGPPGISAARLNKIEQGIADATDLAEAAWGPDNLRWDSGVFEAVDGGVWRIVSPRSAIDVSKSTNQSSISSSNTKITFDIVGKDTLSEWSTVNNRFTAAKAGRYLVEASVLLGFPSSGTQGYMRLYKNGSMFRTIAYENFGNNTGGSDATVVRGVSVVDLNAGDYLEIYCAISGSSTSADAVAGAHTGLRITMLQGA